jgi:hypothetical protein
VLRLFGIRLSIWKNEPLSQDAEACWNRAVAACPGCPIFQRLRLSAEELKAQEEIEKEVEEELASWFAHADKATITNEGDGLQSFSLTYNLEKEAPPERKLWWKRLLPGKN